MITITEIRLTEDAVRQLIALSRAWEEEGCTNGLRANSPQDLREPVFAAMEGERIVGYVFGHVYTEERGLSNLPAGSVCFDVDELYVLPAYRSRGIGGQLFAAVEAYAKTRARFLTLATSTRDYRRVLDFYAERNGMQFYNAFLIKPL